MAVTDLTRLEAANIIIGTIGLSPVNSIVNPSTDVASGLYILDEVTRNTLTEGWHWNTEEDYPLSPNGSQEILWPDSFASMDLSDANNDGDYDIIKRSGKVYDRKNRSYKFDKVLKVRAVLYLEWEDIPQAARNYITICAARKFANRFVGSREIDGFTQNDELMARSQLMDDESRNADYSIWEHTSNAKMLRRNQGYIRFYNR